MAGEFLTQLFWFKNFFEVIPSILKRKDNKKAGISRERVYFYVWLFFYYLGMGFDEKSRIWSDVHPLIFSGMSGISEIKRNGKTIRT